MAVQNFGSGAPGINVTETDLTTTTPAVDTTAGAIAGVFEWGPVGERVPVSDEADLIVKFGSPTNNNGETWFTAASFLSYSNSLMVSRAANTAAVFSAVGAANSALAVASTGKSIYNQDQLDSKLSTIVAADINFVARYAGELGNTLKVSQCESAQQFNSTINLSANAVYATANTQLAISVGNSNGTITIWANTAAANTAQAGYTPSAEINAISNALNIGDYLVVNTNGNSQSLKLLSKGAINIANTAGANTGSASFTVQFDQPLKLAGNIATPTIQRYWEYYAAFDSAPGRSDYVEAYGNTALQLANTAAQYDEMHIVVVDEDGRFSGAAGGILEVYPSVSRVTDAKSADGSALFYKTAINTKSKYIYAAADRAGAVSANAISVVSATNAAPLSVSLTGGTIQSETSTSFASLATAADLFVSPLDVDVSLIMAGKSRDGVNGTQWGNYLIDNLGETRQDCVVFVSPERSDVVDNVSAATDTSSFRGSLRNSSYAVMDSGYKYMYDRYNDVYRWVPLNGDIAGCCVRTDAQKAVWYSPAGTTRGQIKNSVKLAFNPKPSEQDAIFKVGVNPVVSTPGEGTYLNGDKTLLNKSSAFADINVRRLFNAIKKAVTVASKDFLFDFNDEFSRTQFVNTVEPYLRDIASRRGLTDFRIICDDTNNTSEVIDANKFVADIYLKPARSIRYIQLNLVAVRTGVEFTEIVSS